MKTKVLIFLSLLLVVALTFFLTSTSFSTNNTDKTIEVDLNRQKLIAFENSDKIFEFDCITGRAGHETEPGMYHITRKVINYVSHTYKTPMPYSMFFSADGKAIHATQYAKIRSYAKYLGLGGPGSHGCVGLSDEDAKTLYEWAPVGTKISIH